MEARRSSAVVIAEQTSQPSSRAPALVGLGALVTYLAVVALGAVGVRGTDQYWYLADLQQVAAGRGMVSNAITPVVWLAGDTFGPENLPPPIHHVPVTYLAAGINALLGAPYLAWVICNALLALAAAALIFVAGRSLLRPTSAAIVAAVFLLSPQTVWFTLNPLMEQSVVFAATLVALGTVWLDRRPWPGVVLMALGVALVTIPRQTNAVLALCGLALVAVLAFRGRLSWRQVVTFAVLAGGLIAAGAVLLPQYPIYGIDTFLAIGTPADQGLGKALPFYATQADVPFSALPSKALAGVSQALFPATAAELVTETFALGLALFGLVTAPRSRSANLLRLWTVAVLAIYLATALLFQSQARYSATVLPFALLLAGAGVERLMARVQAPPRTVAVTTGVVLVGVAGASLTTAVQYRSAAAPSQAQNRALAAETAGKFASPVLVLGATPGSDSATAPFMQLGALPEAPVYVFSWIRPDQGCVPTEVIDHWQIQQVLAPAGLHEAKFRALVCEPDLWRFDAPAEADTTLTFESKLWRLIERG